CRSSDGSVVPDPVAIVDVGARDDRWRHPHRSRDVLRAGSAGDRGFSPVSITEVPQVVGPGGWL
ncbi:MAG: hypothetical protein M3Q82_04255, partial [Actinomycetota bacterium]|nr:hypothetical protein [Actinomycetota bacterium]